MARRTCLAAALVVLASLVVPSAPARSANFVPACANPSFPGNAVAIDGRCGLEGSGGQEADQDSVKNNFCASGTPAVLSFGDFKQLQTSVEANRAINFGDRDNPGAQGPTRDRAPLKAFGEGKLVQVKAFVLTPHQEGPESVNCEHDFDHEPNKDLFHDIHIPLVETAQLASPQNQTEEEANECQGIVVEMSPHHRPPQWTADNVKKVAAAHHPVRVTGQLFFDSSHVPCVGGKEVRTNPRRFSLWEIHPIYRFESCTADCDGAGTWVPLEQWVNR